jgi:peptidoglycan/xylan/chitin deacetylase (PgdA/CDA1 family)
MTIRAGTMFVDASEQQIRAAIKPALVTGQRLAPQSWPGGAKVAVAITFDVDNEFPMNAVLPVPLSGGGYGGVEGLPRILALLKRHEIPSSFYVPVGSAVLQPRIVPSILEGGHEVGLHGWTHELAPELSGIDEERRLLGRQIEYMQRVTGRTPAGYRAPSLAMTNDSVQLLLEAGLRYDSSFVGMDDCHELLSHGRATGMVEVPNNWILTDWYYLHVDDVYQGSMLSPDAVCKVYTEEFEGAYEEGGLCMLTLHPHVIGHRSRIRMLDRLISYMKSRGHVWFATVEQIASYVAGNSGVRLTEGQPRAR